MVVNVPSVNKMLIISEYTQNQYGFVFFIIGSLRCQPQVKIISDDLCGRNGLKSKVSTLEELYDFFSLELSSQMQRYIKINFKRRFPVQAFAWTLI